MIEVNLIPTDHRGTKRSRGGPRLPSGLGLKKLSPSGDPWTIALVLAGLLVPGAILGLWLTQRSTAAELESRLEAATADSARLADLRAVSDSLTDRQQQIRERVALVERLDRNRYVWPHLMDEVSRALPEVAWLTNLKQLSQAPDVQVQVQGMAASPLVITQFVRNLQASEYIADVRILGSQQQQLDEGLAVQAFTLTVSYRQPPGSARMVPVVPESEL